MYRLSSIILLLFGLYPIFAQSPHEDELKIDCAQCHNPEGWDINYETIQFSHNITEFQLGGTHTQVDCKLCHTNLKFNDTPSDCISCHTDVHSMSVGNDCIRCHTPESWLVDYIPELHEENGFPLIGAHSTASCVDCHLSEPLLIFDRIGNECINCHKEDYLTTEYPNHLEAGFSTNCIDCHSPLAIGWDTEVVNHDFFPLTLGHDIQDCNQCHTSDNYSDISADCVSCHQNDFVNTSNPNHESSGFSNDCASCHTTNPGWTPATINHDFFPLTLGHDIQDCNQCHISDNYSDISADCVSCHQNDYNLTNDPNHQAAQFPTDCVACHTTNPGWTPAAFDHDGQYFPIYSGKHREGEAWSSCVECHSNPASYAVFTCFTCHSQSESNNDHSEVSGYIYDSNACLECHPDGNN
jgi:hypothetical protein